MRLTLQELLHHCRQLDWAHAGPTQPGLAARLVAWFGRSLAVEEVTTARLDDLVATMGATGLPSARYGTNRAVGPATIRRHLAALRVMLLRAQRMGAIDCLPLFPEPRTLREPEAPDLVLTDEWIAALTAELQRQEHADFARLVAFLLETGCRLGEASTLPWERLDWGDDGRLPMVQFIRTKGRRARRVPLRAGALTAARQQITRQGGPWLPGADGSAYVDRFKRAHRAAVDAVCGQLQLSSVVAKQWKTHTLRHTCLSRLAAEGYSAPFIQQWAGHASLDTSQRYIHSAAMDLTAVLRQPSDKLSSVVQ